MKTRPGAPLFAFQVEGDGATCWCSHQSAKLYVATFNAAFVAKGAPAFGLGLSSTEVAFKAR